MFSLYRFYFNYTATTEIYTLSLHDALPISGDGRFSLTPIGQGLRADVPGSLRPMARLWGHAIVQRPYLHLLHTLRRSEEHTSELQSRQYLVCRLLLEKKKRKIHNLLTH